MLSNWFRIAPELERAAARAYERDSWNVCPHPDDVFRAFEYFNPLDTRVVILGQDPYHSVMSNPADPDDIIRKARGSAFGYNHRWPGTIDSSLMNIIDEVHAGTPDSEMIQVYENFDTSLESWSEQGVLLLNTRLTVEADKPMSHAGLGWEEPVQKILKYLYDNTDTVFLLWGAEAQKTMTAATGLHGYNERLLYASHPCKYSAHISFKGCDHFRRANEYLDSKGMEGIKWI